MKLVMTLLCLFVFIGLARQALTWRVYAGMFSGILLMSLYFLLTWQF